MFCDVFNKKQARKLLEGRKIWFIGSSNMRAVYKDFLWLLTHETLAADVSFKIKNEESFLNDKKLSNDFLHNGRNYKEMREFRNGKIHLYFHFITRLYLDHFIELINGINGENAPDVIFLNSCLWDLARWGPDGPKAFRVNLLKTLKLLKSKLPARTRVVWKTSLPVSISASGAIFIDEIKNIVPMLPWHLLEANNYAATCAKFFNFDTIDVHHYLRLQGHFRVKDGVHWSPLTIRYITNIFLTHLALSWHATLPGIYQPSVKFLTESNRILLNEDKLTARVNSKKSFFKKLFEKTENVKRSLKSGIKNKFLKE